MTSEPPRKLGRDLRRLVDLPRSVAAAAQTLEDPRDVGRTVDAVKDAVTNLSLPFERAGPNLRAEFAAAVCAALARRMADGPEPSEEFALRLVPDVALQLARLGEDAGAHLLDLAAAWWALMTISQTRFGPERCLNAHNYMSEIARGHAKVCGLGYMYMSKISMREHRYLQTLEDSMNLYM